MHLTPDSWVAAAPRGDAYIIQLSRDRIYQVTEERVDSAALSGVLGHPVSQAPITAGFLGDTLWLWNGGTFVMTLDLRRVHPASNVAMPKSRFPGTSVIPRAVLVDRTFVVEEVPETSAPTPLSFTGAALLRSDANGRILDTLATLRSSRRSLYVRGDDKSVITRTQPWVIRDMAAVDPSGAEILIVRPENTLRKVDTLTFHRFGFDGVPLNPIRFQYSPVPLSERDITRFIESTVDSAFIRRFASRTSAVRALREALAPPMIVPPVSGVWLVDRGTLWVRRDTGGATELVLFRPNVRPRAAEIPAGATVRAVARDAVWIVQTNGSERVLWKLTVGR